MSINEITFSMFRACNDSHSRKTITLPEFIELVRGDKYRKQIETLRQLLASDQKEEYDKLKRKLPGVTPSGVFEIRRKDSPHTHSGLLCLDFDHCGGNVKTGLSSDPHTLAAFLSPSGEGVKVFVKIDPAKHCESFRYAQRYYREQFDIWVDQQCSDFTRLCFVSHDPEVFFRPEAVSLPFDAETPPPVTLPSDNPVITQCEPSDNPVRLQCNPSDITVQLGEARESGGVQLFSIDDLIQRTIPRKAGRRNNQAMHFARGLRFNCGLPDLTREQLKGYARLWYAQAEPFIGTKSFDETFGDIVQGYRNSTKPLDAPSTRLSTAWEKVCKGAVNALEAEEFEDERIKRLVDLCFALCGKDGTFFLSGKGAGALLGVSHTQAHLWLVKLLGTQHGIIELVKSGDSHGANVYRWKGAQ